MNSDINEDINLNPSVVIKKIKFNDNTEIELSILIFYFIYYYLFRRRF